MKLTLEVSGGFAAIPGLSRPRTIDTSTLDAASAGELESLVNDIAFFACPPVIDTAAKGAADFQTYVVTVHDGARLHSVRLTDPITDPALAQLVARIQTVGQPASP